MMFADSMLESSLAQQALGMQMNPGFVNNMPDTRPYDVLNVYNDLNQVDNQSILTGELDTGIDIGKFVIDTSNYQFS